MNLKKKFNPSVSRQDWGRIGLPIMVFLDDLYQNENTTLYVSESRFSLSRRRVARDSRNYFSDRVRVQYDVFIEVSCKEEIDEDKALIYVNHREFNSRIGRIKAVLFMYV